MSTLTVIRPGMLTTVQDLGRWGYQGAGVPVAGPMDPYSHRLANRLAGNLDEAATLEVTMIGPELEADDDITCAVAGAEFALSAAGVSIACNVPFVLHAGGRLRFGQRRRGARAYLAVRGGFDLPRTLGSRATSLISAIGPFGGRALKAGDALPVGREVAIGISAGEPLSMPAGGTRLRVVLGPHDGMFTREAIDTFLHERYTVTPQSNRMGYRLDGPVLRHVDRADILSDATPVGSIQVPASGQPILLMADRQTTGGYPKIATVISADLAVAGQLAPGDWITFASCTSAAAVAALHRQELRLAGGHP